MTLNILRWRGGSGGDMLLKLISESAEMHTNVKIQSGVSDQGGVLLDFSHLHADRLTQVDCIALDYKYQPSIDPVLLKQELDDIVATEQLWWLKSHYYEQNFYTKHIVDIVVEDSLLPFAVAGNINKTTTLSINFNPLVSKITDTNVRYQYAIYNVAKDFVCPHNTSRTISLTQLLAGWDRLCQTLKLFGITLNIELKNFYENWIRLNKQYLPTSVYQHLVQSQYYDVDHPNLTLVERYCLLALTGQKFQLLDKTSK